MFMPLQEWCLQLNRIPATSTVASDNSAIAETTVTPETTLSNTGTSAEYS